MKILTAFAWLLVGLLLCAVAAWSLLAITYAGPHHDVLRNALSALPVLATLPVLVALGFRRWRWRALTLWLLLFAGELWWWSSLTPSNDRAWQTDVAVLPHATIDGDLVTLHNIRNFDYRSEFDYTPAYYDRTFNIRELTGVDVVAVYWMGPAIAHVFLSFEFGAGNHLAISIETRKEKDEEYSTLKGFFRQYELYYVVADERDVIRLRTHYRNNPVEDVYVYRAAGDLDNGRRLFLEYIRRINQLRSEPEFYNTLTTNCTTSIWLNTLVNQQHLPLDWKILVSGYLPELLFEHGRLQGDGLTFAEVQRRAHVNARALAADEMTDGAAEFSLRIRQNVESASAE